MLRSNHSMHNDRSSITDNSTTVTSSPLSMNGNDDDDEKGRVAKKEDCVRKSRTKETFNTIKQLYKRNGESNGNMLRNKRTKSSNYIRRKMKEAFNDQSSMSRCKEITSNFSRKLHHLSATNLYVNTTTTTTTTTTVNSCGSNCNGSRSDKNEMLMDGMILLNRNENNSIDSTLDSNMTIPDKRNDLDNHLEEKENNEKKSNEMLRSKRRNLLKMSRRYSHNMNRLFAFKQQKGNMRLSNNRMSFVRHLSRGRKKVFDDFENLTSTSPHIVTSDNGKENFLLTSTQTLRQCLPNTVPFTSDARQMRNERLTEMTLDNKREDDNDNSFDNENLLVDDMNIGDEKSSYFRMTKNGMSSIKRRCVNWTIVRKIGDLPSKVSENRRMSLSRRRGRFSFEQRYTTTKQRILSSNSSTAKQFLPRHRSFFSSSIRNQFLMNHRKFDESLLTPPFQRDDEKKKKNHDDDRSMNETKYSPNEIHPVHLNHHISYSIDNILSGVEDGNDGESYKEDFDDREVISLGSIQKTMNGKCHGRLREKGEVEEGEMGNINSTLPLSIQSLMETATTITTVPSTSPKMLLMRGEKNHINRTTSIALKKYNHLMDRLMRMNESTHLSHYVKRKSSSQMKNMEMDFNRNVTLNHFQSNKTKKSIGVQMKKSSLLNDDGKMKYLDSSLRRHHHHHNQQMTNEVNGLSHPVDGEMELIKNRDVDSFLKSSQSDKIKSEFLHNSPIIIKRNDSLIPHSNNNNTNIIINKSEMEKNDEGSILNEDNNNNNNNDDNNDDDNNNNNNHIFRRMNSTCSLSTKKKQNKFHILNRQSTKTPSSTKLWKQGSDLLGKRNNLFRSSNEERNDASRINVENNNNFIKSITNHRHDETKPINGQVKHQNLNYISTHYNKCKSPDILQENVHHHHSNRSNHQTNQSHHQSGNDVNSLSSMSITNKFDVVSISPIKLTDDDNDNELVSIIHPENEVTLRGKAKQLMNKMSEMTISSNKRFRLPFNFTNRTSLSSGGSTSFNVSCDDEESCCAELVTNEFGDFITKFENGQQNKLVNIKSVPQNEEMIGSGSGIISNNTISSKSIHLTNPMTIVTLPKILSKTNLTSSNSKMHSSTSPSLAKTIPTDLILDMNSMNRMNSSVINSNNNGNRKMILSTNDLHFLSTNNSSTIQQITSLINRKGEKCGKEKSNELCASTQQKETKIPSFKLENVEQIPNVPIYDFDVYCSRLHEGNGFQFQKQFDDVELQSNLVRYTTVISSDMINKGRNRYCNIPTYDHSRVQLPSSEHNPHGYINANFIDSYGKLNGYIAAQGPMMHTAKDFWLMVWLKNCRVIVMVTNLVEKGRVKCDNYWPVSLNDPMIFDQLTITLVDIQHFAFYIERIFLLSHKSSPTQQRVVHHFQYIQWPDRGVPYLLAPLLSFITSTTSMNENKYINEHIFTSATSTAISPTSASSSASSPNEQSNLEDANEKTQQQQQQQQQQQHFPPIVIHCSAGVGRTGTYIAIDDNLSRMNHTSEVNIVDCLNRMRSQRISMVQTEQQFIHVHDVIRFVVNNILLCRLVGCCKNASSKSTITPLKFKSANNISVSIAHHPNELTDHVNKLEEGLRKKKNSFNYDFKTKDLWMKSFYYSTFFERFKKFNYSILDLELDIINSIPIPYTLSLATSPKHKEKNATNTLLPSDYACVRFPKWQNLMDEGMAYCHFSEYLNASIIPGHFSHREFIMMPHPFDKVIEDFWISMMVHRPAIIVGVYELNEEETIDLLDKNLLEKLSDKFAIETISCTVNENEYFEMRERVVRLISLAEIDFRKSIQISIENSKESDGGKSTLNKSGMTTLTSKKSNDYEALENVTTLSPSISMLSTGSSYYSTNSMRESISKKEKIISKENISKEKESIKEEKGLVSLKDDEEFVYCTNKNLIWPDFNPRSFHCCEIKVKLKEKYNSMNNYRLMEYINKKRLEWSINRTFEAFHDDQSIKSISNPINIINQLRFLSNYPTVLHDVNGGKSSAILSASITANGQIQHLSNIDVHGLAITLHQLRPGIWKESEHLLLLYKSIEYIGRQLMNCMAIVPRSVSSASTLSSLNASSSSCSNNSAVVIGRPSTISSGRKTFDSLTGNDNEISTTKKKSNGNKSGGEIDRCRRNQIKQQFFSTDHDNVSVPLNDGDLQLFCGEKQNLNLGNKSSTLQSVVPITTSSRAISIEYNHLFNGHSPSSNHTSDDNEINEKKSSIASFKKLRTKVPVFVKENAKNIRKQLLNNFVYLTSTTENTSQITNANSKKEKNVCIFDIGDQNVERNKVSLKAINNLNNNNNNNNNDNLKKKKSFSKEYSINENNNNNNNNNDNDNNNKDSLTSSFSLPSSSSSSIFDNVS
ncbi:hypothetical protein SNEBB_005560 [Seison nebaliae]|nr:hypothetical protein SNEBB_005560 [Seison nebaliae]